VRTRHPKRQKRLLDEGSNLAQRLLHITRRRGLVARPASIEQIVRDYAPNLPGISAVMLDAPVCVTLICAPYAAFHDPALRPELDAVRSVLNLENRRAIVVPRRCIMLRTKDLPPLRPRRHDLYGRGRRS
jgi:hypothetical protein